MLFPKLLILSQVTSEGITGGPAATFTSRKGHIFNHSEPASVMFAAGILHEEMVFLLLVLLWCEHRRLETKVNSLSSSPCKSG